MYFIKRGKVQLTHCVDEEEVGLFQLGTGSHFGEAALVNVTPRTANALALTYCHLLMLHRSDFNIVSANYPELQHELMKTREKRPPCKIQKTASVAKVSSLLRSQMGGMKAAQVAPEPAALGDTEMATTMSTSHIERGSRLSRMSGGALILTRKLSRKACSPQPDEDASFRIQAKSKRCSFFATSLIEERARMSRMNRQGAHSRVSTG